MYENTERWENAVPSELIPAVEHLRTSFEDIHWGCGQTSARFCYALLHNEPVKDPAGEYIAYLMHMKATLGPVATRQFDDLVKRGSAPSIFKAFFELYMESVSSEALRIFSELAQVGRANVKRLSAPYLDWAEAQTKHLIRSQGHLIEIWVRNVCDKQSYDPNDLDESLYWRKWAAPMLLVMEPSRFMPYDAAKAWDRNDITTSSDWLRMFRETYVIRLEGKLRKTAGATAVELAKKPDSFESERASRPEGPMKPAAMDGRPTGTSVKREAQKLETQTRHKAWQKEYRVMRKAHPGMSDVWYAQRIAKINNNAGHSADTIRKHMTK